MADDDDELTIIDDFVSRSPSPRLEILPLIFWCLSLENYDKYVEALGRPEGNRLVLVCRINSAMGAFGILTTLLHFKGRVNVEVANSILEHWMGVWSWMIAVLDFLCGKARNKRLNIEDIQTSVDLLHYFDLVVIPFICDPVAGLKRKGLAIPHMDKIIACLWWGYAAVESKSDGFLRRRYQWVSIRSTVLPRLDPTSLTFMGPHLEPERVVDALLWYLRIATDDIRSVVENKERSDSQGASGPLALLDETLCYAISACQNEECLQLFRSQAKTAVEYLLSAIETLAYGIRQRRKPTASVDDAFDLTTAKASVGGCFHLLKSWIELSEGTAWVLEALSQGFLGTLLNLGDIPLHEDSRSSLTSNRPTPAAPHFTFITQILPGYLVYPSILAFVEKSLAYLDALAGTLKLQNSGIWLPWTRFRALAVERLEVKKISDGRIASLSVRDRCAWSEHKVRFFSTHRRWRSVD